MGTLVHFIAVIVFLILTAFSAKDAFDASRAEGLTKESFKKWLRTVCYAVVIYCIAF